MLGSSGSNGHQHIAGQIDAPMALFALTTLGTITSKVRSTIRATLSDPLTLPFELEDENLLNLQGKAGDSGEVISFCEFKLQKLLHDNIHN